MTFERYDNFLISRNSVEKFIEATKDPNKKVHIGEFAVIPGFQSEFLAMLVANKYIKEKYSPDFFYSSQTTTFENFLIPEKNFSIDYREVPVAAGKGIEVVFGHPESRALRTELVYLDAGNLRMSVLDTKTKKGNSVEADYYTLNKSDIEVVRSEISSYPTKNNNPVAIEATLEDAILAYAISLSSNSIARYFQKVKNSDINKNLQNLFPVYKRHKINVFYDLYNLKLSEGIELVTELSGSKGKICTIKTYAFDSQARPVYSITSTLAFVSQTTFFSNFEGFRKNEQGPSSETDAKPFMDAFIEKVKRNEANFDDVEQVINIYRKDFPRLCSDLENNIVNVQVWLDECAALISEKDFPLSPEEISEAASYHLKKHGLIS